MTKSRGRGRPSTRGRGRPSKASQLESPSHKEIANSEEGSVEMPSNTKSKRGRKPKNQSETRGSG